MGAKVPDAPRVPRETQSVVVSHDSPLWQGDGALHQLNLHKQRPDAGVSDAGNILWNSVGSWECWDVECFLLIHEVRKKDT
jgi:hypothetical protein